MFPDHRQSAAGIERAAGHRRPFGLYFGALSAVDGMFSSVGVSSSSRPVTREAPEAPQPLLGLLETISRVLCTAVEEVDDSSLDGGDLG